MSVSEDSVNRPLLHVGKKVSIASSHFVRLVADPRVDDSLVNSLAGTAANKAVPKNVPPSEYAPSGCAERALQMVRGLMYSQSVGLAPGLATSQHG